MAQRKERDLTGAQVRSGYLALGRGCKERLSGSGKEGV